MLEPYAWVEFKSPLREAPCAGALMSSGFFLADTQIPFRIRLPAARHPARAGEFDLVSAAEGPLAVGAREMAPFGHERFTQLPGITVMDGTERYAQWAALLAEQYPSTCLELRAKGRPQGWFLAEPKDGRVIALTLAMLHREARISGLLLYSLALDYYASQGFRVGTASFSVRNTEVHNLYARLGAHFLAPVGIWMRAGKDRSASRSSTVP
jgi:hypothetical protein